MDLIFCGCFLLVQPLAGVNYTSDILTLHTIPSYLIHTTDTIRVMEGCGVSYTLSKVIEAEPTKYNNNNSNSHSQYNNNTSAKPYTSNSTNTNTSHTNSYNNTSKFTPYNNNTTDVILKLDPAFDELLVYPECEELVGRHIPVVPEMRQVLYTEQRKHSIQIKVGITIYLY